MYVMEPPHLIFCSCQPLCGFLVFDFFPPLSSLFPLQYSTMNGTAATDKKLSFPFVKIEIAMAGKERLAAHV